VFHLLERGKVVASSESLHTILGYLEGFPRLIDGSVQSVVGVEVLFEHYGVSATGHCSLLGTVVRKEGKDVVEWRGIQMLIRGYSADRWLNADRSHATPLHSS